MILCCPIINRDSYYRDYHVELSLEVYLYVCINVSSRCQALMSKANRSLACAFAAFLRYFDCCSFVAEKLRLRVCVGISCILHFEEHLAVPLIYI